ncbi:excinuclease ABC subunit UvrA [Paenibacillus sp. FA6]|uniref:excinuclease ABC subunit UvrA n=1 Tax=Paenibacillus sp. FA6 TaxID=3413029 RepID=UPI003F656020
MAIDNIVIKGARAHNLKNIDITIPRDRFVVITGLSGSGKSSLAFDTIYAEGQRRYVESLSAYARQFLGQMEKPDVDSIEGLSPAISIDQKTTSRNPRSTVGTVTEIYDYLRLLFARVGHPHCPTHGVEITSQTVEQMVDRIIQYPEKTKIQLLAPVISGRKGEHKGVFTDISKQGFVRVRVDGELRELSEDIELEKNKKHTIEVVVDRIVIKEGVEARLADSIETALKISEGQLLVDVMGEELRFSSNFACPICGFSMEELSPRMFSFNSPFGACVECDGLGVKMIVDQDLLIPDSSKSIDDGAFLAWTGSTSNYYPQFLKSVSEHFKIPQDVPVSEFTPDQMSKLLYGTGEEKIRFKYENDFGQRKEALVTFEGVIPNLERRYRETASDGIREFIEGFMSAKPCEVCKGHRLKKEVLAVTVDNHNIADVTSLSIGDAVTLFDSLVLSEKETAIATMILKEINSRLGFLINVGLDYLSLSRAAGTLSGGEAQRIRLATQIGSSLMGVLYILDEPSIGLHQRDNDRLIATLGHMRDLGNTLIVVEHDEDTMMAADHIIDIGPGAGIHGGRVIAQGTPQEIMDHPDSLTGQYLSGRKFIPVNAKRRKPEDRWLEIKGAKENNLKNINVKIPLGVFTAVTGVSGSGKSTLINEILYKKLARELNGATKVRPGKHKEINGLEHLDKVIDIDQSPIGRTPRSNPATYTGVFDDIRDIYAQTNEAKIRGYKKGRFSFNVKGGRCEACRGDGIIKIEMHFLPDVYVPCEICKGKRYNRETLEVKYKSKSIAEVLEMTIEDATEFFKNVPRIHRKLQTLLDVGLGYVHMGQPATTLSGGEAQRVKLASELYRRSTGKTMYILDEPTTGLHVDDIGRLLTVLHRLVDSGETVLVIEHNLDVIKTADYVIDLGPEGGSGGGTILTTGTPEQIVKVEKSYTGKYLKPVLERDTVRSKDMVVVS